MKSRLEETNLKVYWLFFFLFFPSLFPLTKGYVFTDFREKAGERERDREA